MKASIELEKKVSLTMTDSLIGEFSRTKLVGYGLNNLLILSVAHLLSFNVVK